MAQSLKKQEEKRKSWFGLASSSGSSTPTTGEQGAAAVAVAVAALPAPKPATTALDDTRNNVVEERRKFLPLSVVVPSKPRQVIPAHHKDASCVR
jgi:hypothetical protein